MRNAYLPAAAFPEPTAQARRGRLPRWLLAVGFWTLIILVYSTRTELRSGNIVWIPMSWFDSLKFAAAQWVPWGVLSVGIYWVNRMLPFRSDALVKRLLAHVPLSLVFGVAYTYLNGAMTVLIDAPSETVWVGANFLETFSRVTYRLGTFVYWAIVAISVALDYQSDLKDREIRAAELERLLTEARLDTLRSQLNPHFLFNALNSISAYVESAPREARQMIEQLGDLLRLSLEHASEQELSLERELDFIGRYLQIQLVRFADRLDVRMEVAPEVTTAVVPTFVLQPLIENAVRHGVAQLTTAGVIELKAWREGRQLRLSVRDNGPGLPQGWNLDRDAGIGLGNTRARLEHLYGPGGYRLDVTAGKDGGTLAQVAIPFREA